MATPENPPAFPNHPAIQIDGGPNDWIGMTLRDWFAGQAITMCLKDVSLGFDAWAREAYAVADALLAARQTTDREDGK